VNKLFFTLEKYLGSALVLALGATLRIKRTGIQPKEPVIYAFWHRNMIPLLYLHRYQKIGIMISSSKDGELIAGPCKALGYVPVRGSSTRGGSQAVRQMVKHSRRHCCAITPGGPKGPAQEVKDGLLYLAYAAKRPIVPVGVQINKEWIFNSWDRFRFPKPFARITVHYGLPIGILTKEDITGKHAQVQAALLEVSQEK
jgi:lysophospholipid acyltransferase (LPLAT)-like uncharacterized protein